MAAFIIGRPRMDAVAACAFIILVISGIVEPYEALAAFSDSSIIIIASQKLEFLPQSETGF